MAILDDLARDLVGDGNHPNLYFVTNNRGQTLVVMLSKEDAIEYALNVGGYLVEDRINGEVWGSAEYNRVQREEDPVEEARRHRGPPPRRGPPPIVRRRR